MTAYTERLRLKYTSTQLFDLVADVERYPEFMSWVVEARMSLRADHTFLVNMTVAAGPLQRRFVTTGVMQRPHRIDVTSNDPIFDRFLQWWTFESAAPGETNVECHIECRLRPRLLQMLMAVAFPSQAAATVSAFKDRAHRLYGIRA